MIPFSSSEEGQSPFDDGRECIGGDGAQERATPSLGEGARMSALLELMRKKAEDWSPSYETTSEPMGLAPLQDEENAMLKDVGYRAGVTSRATIKDINGEISWKMVEHFAGPERTAQIKAWAPEFAQRKKAAFDAKIEQERRRLKGQ